jgi:hypothetical protein
MNQPRSRGRWFRALAGLAAPGLVVLLGATARSDRGLRPRLEAEAIEYVRLAVALGERDPDSLDFYVGSPELVRDVRADPPPLRSIKRSAEAAISRLAAHRVADGERLRQQQLLHQLAALTARASLLLGDRPPYDVESRALFGVAPGPPADRHFARIRAGIDALIPGPGPLVDRLADYESRFVVPPERLPAVFEQALAECRRRTLENVQLPSDAGVTTEFVGNKPWAAYSRYLGGGRSIVSLNTDFRFTIDRLLETACHEAYPGHHLRNTLVDDILQGRRLPEFTVQPLFSPRTLLAEGSAMYAAALAFSDDERAAFERDQLFPAAGIAGDAKTYVRVAQLVEELQDVQVHIARQYLDGELEFARASAALEEQALMRDTGAMLKYINEYRTYVTAYTLGRQAAKTFVDACAAGSGDRDRRWKCFERLLTADISDRQDVQ